MTLESDRFENDLPGGDAVADPASDPAMRAELLRLRAEAGTESADLGAQVRGIAAARADSNSDDEHDPEGSTIAFEQSQADALRGATERRLAQIDAALARLDTGAYGRCQVCGDPIAPARLAARPFATTCIRHA